MLCLGQENIRIRHACVKKQSDIHKTGQDVLKAAAFPEGEDVCMTRGSPANRVDANVSDSVGFVCEM